MQRACWCSVIAVGALGWTGASLAQVPLLAEEEAKLTAPNPGPYDWLGNDVALDGDTAVAVAPNANFGAGPSHVYVRSGTSWTLQAQLVSGGGTYAYGVDIDGDTVAIGRIGGTGVVDVFVRSGTSWSLQASVQMVGPEVFDNFGLSLSLRGDTLVVGAPNDDTGAGVDTGSAVVFVRSGSSWTQQQALTASDGAPGDYFGTAVALDGDTAVVGAPRNGSGAAYVFVRSGTTWTEQALLTEAASVGDDWFGGSVSLCGDTLAVGAPYRDMNNPCCYEQGAVLLYERSGSTWGAPERIQASDPFSLDEFGRSVSVEGNTLVVGAPYKDVFQSGFDAGAAYVFDRAGTTWSESARLKAADGALGDAFGQSVDLSGKTIGIGAYNDTHSGVNQAGSTYVFRLSHPPVTYCTAGVSAAGCSPAIGATGAASASAAAGFVLTAASAEGARSGLFYYGSSGRLAGPWGNGTSFQCVAPPTKRGSPLTAGGTAGVCDGSFALDLNARWCPTCPKPGHNPGVGAIVQAQLWYRDPQNTSNQTTSLSDALEFLVEP